MPLIIMTGRAMKGIAVKIMKLGVCDYIVNKNQASLIAAKNHTSDV